MLGLLHMRCIVTEGAEHSWTCTSPRLSLVLDFSCVCACFLPSVCLFVSVSASRSSDMECWIPPNHLMAAPSASYSSSHSVFHSHPHVVTAKVPHSSFIVRCVSANSVCVCACYRNWVCVCKTSYPQTHASYSWIWTLRR